MVMVNNAVGVKVLVKWANLGDDAGKIGVISRANFRNLWPNSDLEDEVDLNEESLLGDE